MQSGEPDGWSAGSAAIAGLAVALTLGFTANLAWELRALSAAGPPLVGFLLGVALTGALAYAALWLERRPYYPGEERRIAGWAAAGAVLLTLVSVVSLAVRGLEGRSVGEPQLSLLLSASAGGLAGVIAGHREVVARRRTVEVKRTRDTLSFLNRTLRHEMLNGVQLLVGHARNLQDHVDGEAVHSLETIEGTSEELADLIENVREVADVHAGRADLRPVDVTAMLADDVDWLAGAYPETTVETDLPDRALVTASDALDHAFRNLLTNAAEHGGDAPSVEVAVDRDDDDVAVRVADDGPGIADAHRATVLDADEDGTHGFGLHLTRTLVEGYGGSIDVADNDPTGAVFEVCLPRSSQPRADGAPGAGEPDPVFGDGGD